MDNFEFLRSADEGEAIVAHPKTRERRAIAALHPSLRAPDAQLTASASEPSRGRQTRRATQPTTILSADNQSASSTRQGCRSHSDATPNGALIGGQQSDASHGAVSDDGGAHSRRALQAQSSPAVVISSAAVRDTHSTGIPADAAGDEGAQAGLDLHKASSPLVVEIQQLWRMRQRWHRAEKSLVLQGKAICRSWTAGDKIAADKLFTASAKGQGGDPSVDMALMPFLSAIERFQAERTAIEKQLRKLAAGLPFATWTAEVKGFGLLNLAALVGEAGEISAYRNPSCLWKRMGLAVIDGGRQRRVADAELAVAHGYAPARRCVAYLLGDTLIKAGDSCRYRPVYTARRERSSVTHPDWTKAHSHNDAARIMVKRVLRDLWIEARRNE